MSINQYSPANFNDVDLQQLINEPEMFPFNWEKKKLKSQEYSSVAELREMGVHFQCWQFLEMPW